VRPRDKKILRRIVRERIIRLFQLAEENAEAHPERARRYVELARKLSTKNKVPIPREWKRRFCKNCGAFWIPGKNVIIRTKPRPQPHVEFICLECGARYRYPYLREKLKVGKNGKRSTGEQG